MRDATDAGEDVTATALARRSAAELAGRDAVAAHLGIEVADVGPGTATARLRVLPTMTNGHGVTHGGYVFLLADTAFAYACNSRGRATVASGGDIDFLEPTHAEDLLVATARERVLRGRSGLYDVRVTRADVVVAELRGRSRALAVRAAPGAPPEPSPDDVEP